MIISQPAIDQQLQKKNMENTWQPIITEAVWAYFTDQF